MIQKELLIFTERENERELMMAYLGSNDSKVHLFWSRGRHLADDRLIRGVDAVKGISGNRIHKLPVDEALVRALDLPVVGSDHSLMD